MKKENLNKVLIAIFTFCCVGMGSCGQKNEPSRTLTEYSERDDRELRSLYFYPTTIRMLSKILGDENGQALKEIQKARLFFSWSDDESGTREVLNSFKSGIEEEGFEMLMRMNSSGDKVDIYMLDSELDDYILFVDGVQGTFVLEILGNLSPSALRDLSKMDMNKMMELVNFVAPENQIATDSVQTDSLRIDSIVSDSLITDSI